MKPYAEESNSKCSFKIIQYFMVRNLYMVTA